MSEQPIEDAYELTEADVAARLGTTTDPLAEISEKLDDSDNLFKLFVRLKLQNRGYREATLKNYETVYKEWWGFMDGWKEDEEEEEADVDAKDRHPCCPREQHVVEYIEWQLGPEAEGGKGNRPRTVREKLRKLNDAYAYWQTKPAYDYPTSYNPFTEAEDTMMVALRDHEKKPYRRLSEEDLREMVASVTHLRSRAIILMQLKLGLRAGEVCNLKLEDLSLVNEELRAHFPELGGADELPDDENAVFIPKSADRKGNKSKRERLLPVDGELRGVLIHYLLVRPDNGEPWVFLSQKTHSQLDPKAVNQVWKDEFHPEYAETDDHRAVTSHFGRHRFVSWWRVEKDMNRQLVKYMRGDKNIVRDDLPAREDGSPWPTYRRESIDDYIHVYYEDIKEEYKAGIYRLLKPKS